MCNADHLLVKNDTFLFKQEKWIDSIVGTGLRRIQYTQKIDIWAVIVENIIIEAYFFEELNNSSYVQFL